MCVKLTQRKKCLLCELSWKTTTVILRTASSFCSRAGCIYRICRTVENQLVEISGIVSWLCPHCGETFPPVEREAEPASCQQRHKKLR